MVREFYSNLVGRKDNTVFVRGVWVPYGAKAINEAYRMAGHKHGSKFKKLLENPNLDKIAKKLTDGKAQLRQEKGGPKILNRGSLTEEAKVWFYFLASVLVPTRHLSTVREQEANMLYAILKGYKINIGTIIENSIMRYHEGNKRGVIPHPATITVLCLKAGVKGAWETEEEVPLTSPLLLTGVSKRPRSQKKKGSLIKTREEAPTARQEEENSENPVETNTFTFADNEEQTKENINGLKFLYMSLLKDFETKMEGRDKVLDDNDAYRRKMWLENLDLINNNLSKFLEVMTELEKNMNTLGMRQDELNKKVDLTNKLAQEEQTDKEKAKGKRRIEVNIPEFSPKLDTLDLDPPNIYTRKQKRKK